MYNRLESYLNGGKEDFIFQSDMIICTLANKERNSDLLKSIPFTPLHDMAVIFRYLLMETKLGLCTTIITNKMMEEYQIDRATLLQKAIKNTERLFPVKMQVISDETESFDGFYGILTPEEERLFQNNDNKERKMYVLSNKTGILGANVIIYNHLVDNLADKLQSSLIVIPSSIHEVLIMKADYPIETATEILHSINHSCVNEEEILSDKVLYVEWKKNRKGRKGNANFLI